jgi:spermidine synthase
VTGAAGVLAVYAVFLLSGISGLIYQVVWVRVFGNVFGNDVYSAAIVIAVFMCGLGVGSYAIGRWADRRYREGPRALLRAYAICELAIAGLALALALLLPNLERFSAAVSVYQLDPEGWHALTPGSYAIRYSLAVLLLAPVTLLMGGTLTLLIRALVARDLSLAGWRIGALYGINTLGAACGAFASDFALIPSLGIFRTELVAVVLNVVAGAGALLLARVWVAPSVPVTRAPASDPVPAGASRRLLLGTGSALFLSGLTALGMEILWFRYMISLIGSFRAVLSLLLSVILLGICIGSLLGGWLHRRWGHPVTFFALAQTSFVLVSLAALAGFDPGSVSAPLPGFEQAYRTAGSFQQLLLQTWYNLRPILAVVGLPSLLMGLGFPLANAHVQQIEADVGRRAGALYLANTFGNVAGSLLVGFVLLPRFGMQASVWLLALCAALALLPLRWSAGEQELAVRGRRPPVLACCMALIVAALVGWSALPAHRLLKLPQLPPEQTAGRPVRVLSVSEGIHESIVVIEIPGLARRLYTNGHPMSSTHPMSQRYMRLFSHLPLLQMESPKRVLVICFGVGNTLHAASLHPSVERLEAVDLSRNVLGQAHFFRQTNGNVLRDPRSQIFINDGRQHLRTLDPASLDLITLEPPPISFAGVSSLYTREFYQLARSRLVPGGFLTQWLPAYQVPGDTLLALIRSFLDAFPHSVLLSGHERELILMGVNGDRLEFDPERVGRKLAENPALREDLERIEAASLTELVGTFVAGTQTLERVTRDAPAVTDDRPLTEYSTRAYLLANRIPEQIFDVSGVASWCPDCFADGHPVTELMTLPAYLATLAACYRDEGFRSYSVSQSFQKPGEAGPLPELPGQDAALRQSRYLNRIYLPPCAFERPGASARSGASAG